MARGRKKKIVNESRLRYAIEQAEKDGPLSTQNEVYEKAAEIYNNGNSGDKLTHSVVMLRCKEFGIELKTKVSRGRRKMTEEQKQAMAEGRGQRRSKAEKFAENPALQLWIKQLEKEVPPNYSHILEKVKSGSRAAANHLKCLECSGYQSAEIRKCTVIGCPLWGFRPSQGAIEDEKAKFQVRHNKPIESEKEKEAAEAA